MVAVKKLSFILVAIILVVSVAEARRGFSSSGSGKGRYSSDSSTSSWNVNSTLDADCQAQYGQPCAELTTGQYEIVQQKYTQATNAGYASNTDYVTASAIGYGLTSSDGSLWSSAKSWAGNSAQNADCNSAYSGACNAISKTNFNDIYDGRQDAIDNGFTGYSDWLDAQALGYSQDNTTDDPDLGDDTSDAELWAEAKGNSIQTACQAEDSTITNCNELTRTQYKDAKQGNALIAAKKTIVTNGNLAASDLSELLGSDWASSSALTSSPSAWQLDYLETVLGTGANITKSDWQTTIDNYNAATASAWYIWKIAASSDSSGTYAASNATTTLFNNAGVSAAVTALGVTNSQIATDIRSSGFSASPTATQMNDFLTEARGFADGTTYASVTTATGNSWTVANYVTATSNGGWTSSSADKATFDSCLSSSDDATGGSSTCSVSKSGWETVDAIASVADGDANLTASNVTSILSATGATANSSVNTSDSKHMDYLQSCASGDDAAQAVSDCASSSSFLANATSFEIGKAVADNSGSYTIASVITTSTLGDAGIASNSTNVIGGNYCGAAGDSSCLAALKTALASSGLTASSTASQVTAKINELMRAQMVTAVSAAAIPSASPAGGCSSSVNLSIPAQCGHPQWTCTLQSGPSGWTLSGGNLVVPANATAGNNQSATVRMSLGIYTPAYTKDVTQSYNVKAAVAGATNGKKRYNNGSSENVLTAQTACRNLGGRLATHSEHNSLGNTSYELFHWSTSDPDMAYTINDGNARRVAGKSCHFGYGSKYSRKRKHDGWHNCGGTGVNATIYYTCADLPSC